MTSLCQHLERKAMELRRNLGNLHAPSSRLTFDIFEVHYLQYLPTTVDDAAKSDGERFFPDVQNCESDG
jgi:hypothetical protein